MKVMLEVYHKGEYKPVGKVFTQQKDGVLIFLHEESGNQGHHNLGAPGGIDLVIVPDLQGWGVEEVHHYNRRERCLYYIGLDTLLREGTRQRSGGRDRVYTHWKYWHTERGPLRYPVPWASDVIRYGGEHDGFTQLNLFGEAAEHARANQRRTS